MTFFVVRHFVSCRSGSVWVRFRMRYRRGVLSEGSRGCCCSDQSVFKVLRYFSLQELLDSCTVRWSCHCNDYKLQTYYWWWVALTDTRSHNGIEWTAHGDSFDVRKEILLVVPLSAVAKWSWSKLVFKYVWRFLCCPFAMVFWYLHVDLSGRPSDNLWTSVL